MAVGNVGAASSACQLGQQDQRFFVVGQISRLALGKLQCCDGLVAGLQGAHRCMEVASCLGFIGRELACQQVQLRTARIVRHAQRFDRCAFIKLRCVEWTLLLCGYLAVELNAHSRLVELGRQRSQAHLLRPRPIFLCQRLQLTLESVAQ